MLSCSSEHIHRLNSVEIKILNTARPSGLYPRCCPSLLIVLGRLRCGFAQFEVCATARPALRIAQARELEIR